MHDAVHHGQAHARALARRLGREEGLEHALGDLRAHAGPGVGHGQLEEGAIHRALAAGADTANLPVAQLQVHAPAAIHRVARVDAEIEHHLLRLHRIDDREAGIRIDAGGQRDRRRHRGAQDLRGLLDHLGQRDPARIATALAAAEGEHLADQVARAPAGVLGLVEVLEQLGIGLRRGSLLGQHHVAHDAGQQVVEIVRDAARQVTDGFHLLGLAKLFFAARERLLARAPLAHVARDRQHVRHTLMLHRDEAQLDVEEAAVGTHGLRLQVAGLAFQRAAHEPKAIIDVVGGVGARHLPFDDVLALEAVHLQACRVDVDDAQLVVPQDEGVGRGIEDGAVLILLHPHRLSVALPLEFGRGADAEDAQQQLDQVALEQRLAVDHRDQSERPAARIEQRTRGISIEALREEQRVDRELVMHALLGEARFAAHDEAAGRAVDLVVERAQPFAIDPGGHRMHARGPAGGRVEMHGDHRRIHSCKPRELARQLAEGGGSFEAGDRQRRLGGDGQGSGQAPGFDVGGAARRAAALGILDRACVGHCSLWCGGAAQAPSK